MKFKKSLIGYSNNEGPAVKKEKETKYLTV
jgi:hypothetical protein